MNYNIAVIGLGYVGLPLAVALSKKYNTIGFDINSNRVCELNGNIDSTLEVTTKELIDAESLSFSANIEDTKKANVYIVTVPTPVDIDKKPDLTPLISASEMLSKVVTKNDIVIYESTVYPGATEEVCVPALLKFNDLTYNKDIFVGYSPERINPGDKDRDVTSIKKVTSGSNVEVAEVVDRIYNSIITAGTYKASSIKVAEASKVIENVQRDVNIALINELHQIFDRLDINTREVIEAASTKWNFMKLFPGLVGGHCIGVDPYYLLYKSQSKGYIPDLMRTAREINDTMPGFLIESYVKDLVKQGINPVGLDVLILGFTFKENCPDIRNTKVVELYHGLKNYGFNVEVYDPWADPKEVEDEYLVKLTQQYPDKVSSCFLAVGHEEILTDINMNKIKYSHIYDYKNIIL